MEQMISGFAGMADMYVLEWLAAICLILIAVAMALFDLPMRNTPHQEISFTCLLIPKNDSTNSQISPIA